MSILYAYMYVCIWDDNGNQQKNCICLSFLTNQSFEENDCGSLTELFLSIRGFAHLGAGLSVGFSGLAAGFAIGIVGDAGVRGTAQQPRLFVGMILILIFAEVLGLYGLIVAIYLYTK